MDAARGRSADDAASVIHPALAATLAARGYDVLTPVQLAVLDHAASGADLLVSAQTGSGKTVAFGMAIAPTLLDDQPRFGPAGQPLALVVAPTRELALQVQRELDWLYADAGVSTASSVGGMDIRTERRAIGRGAHIVVGTPGRLRDHITKGALDLSAITAVVLDEADEMLDLGFREDLEFILGAAPAERRTLMFSATVPPAIAQLAKTFQRDAIRVTATASSERHADIEYQMLVVPADEREQAIVNALLYFDSRSTLVFCHTREAVKTLTTRLTGRGFDVVTLSGELSQAERTNALQAMRDGRARVCVATDVAARGLDLPNLDLVIHADLPSKPDTLLHRSGRTGRAGRKGICVLIVPVFKRAAAARVLRAANVEAITRGAPTTAEIAARYRQNILDAAVAAAPPDAEEAKLGAELLARVTPEQVAALYVRQQQALRPVPEAVTTIAIPVPTERGARTVERGREVGRDVRDDPRKADMQGGVWFTLSLGRKHRADPKWLLPMICKAGEVTKRDVGSIKIGDSETRFEISADKAQGFAESLARSGSGEKGVVIKPAGGDAGAGWTPSGAPRAARSAHKPARVAAPEAPSPPATARTARPDKKPYPGRSRPPVTAGWTPEGQEPRKRPAKKPHRKGGGPA